jgi:hypothetical protein
MSLPVPLSRALALAGAAVIAAAAVPACAQSLPYNDRFDDSAENAGERGNGGARTTVQPYLEAAQVITAELSPGNDVLTYSSLAAGVDATIAGRRTQGQVSLRYERRIGWGNAGADGDAVTGIARVRHDILPRSLSIEAGALAARTRVEGSGGSSLNPVNSGDAVTQVYSFYAGPSFSTHAGEVALSGSAAVGYNRVESPDALSLAPGQPRVDVFDDSVTTSAQLAAGIRPGAVLPVGMTLSGAYAREDISNLDQRVEDAHVQLDLLYPISIDLALVAGVGYESVQVSSRDAVRDINGDPVVGADGRFITDHSAPRVIGYDVDGLIWDAGVMWRPSRRTSLSATVGRRYGSTSYTGSFAWAPDDRRSVNVSVYDTVSGLGGAMNRALRDLPTDFEVTRNPVTGNLNGCVTAPRNGLCLNNALSSVSSGAFRSRGISMSYSQRLGRLSAGLGLGYDRRKFLAAPGTVLALANGVIDENWFLGGSLSGPLGREAGFNTSVYANWYQSGFSSAGDANAYGANASYYRNLTDRLIATAAISVDGIERKVLDDEWFASALLGLRYNF